MTEIYLHIVARMHGRLIVHAPVEKAQANRALVPWVVAHGHQSLYCSTADDADCNLPFSPAFNFRLALEPLFFGESFFKYGCVYN